MKKTVVLLLILSIIASACSVKSDNIDEKHQEIPPLSEKPWEDESATTGEQTTTTEALEEPFEENDSGSVAIEPDSNEPLFDFAILIVKESVEYECETIEIPLEHNQAFLYPQFQSMGNNSMLTKKINKQIADLALQWVESEWWDFSFKIGMSNDDVLSIIFYGNLSAPRRFLYAMNFDLKSGERIDVSKSIDLAGIDLGNPPAKENIIVLEESPMELDVQSQALDAFLISREESGKDIDLLSLLEYSNNQIFIDSSSKVIFFIAVPHALGDYITVAF